MTTEEALLSLNILGDCTLSKDNSAKPAVPKWLQIVGALLAAVAAITAIARHMTDTKQPSIAETRLSSYLDDSFSWGYDGTSNDIVKVGVFFDNTKENPLRITNSYLDIKTIKNMQIAQISFQTFWLNNKLFIWVINNGNKETGKHCVRLEAHIILPGEKLYQIPLEDFAGTSSLEVEFDSLKGGSAIELLAIQFNKSEFEQYVDETIAFELVVDEVDERRLGELFIGSELGWGGFGDGPGDYSTNIFLDTANAKKTKKVGLDSFVGGVPSISKSEAIIFNIVPDKTCKVRFNVVFSANGRKIKTSTLTATVIVPYWKLSETPDDSLVHDLHALGLRQYDIGDIYSLEQKWRYSSKERYEELETIRWGDL